MTVAAIRIFGPQGQATFILRETRLTLRRASNAVSFRRKKILADLLRQAQFRQTGVHNDVIYGCDRRNHGFLDAPEKIV